ncbi:MAG: septal ring lytic transglycosylase RlpA family protein [Bacteroidales bacterium]|nr:septal ring lytic transglycosylase RlpA family protein [Bacteroidales bacterium]
MAQSNFVQTGKASFYSDKFEGRYTASGEKYVHEGQTAAHLTLPFNTMVKVTNLDNKRTTTVRINDRGPFIRGRIIDLSKKAATDLGIFTEGLANVKIEVIEKTEPAGNTGPSKNMTPTVKPETEVAKPSVPAANSNVAEGSQSMFFNINAHNVTPGGYGIQVASYKESDNFLRMVTDLKENFKLEVFVQVAQINDAVLYRIIVGDFAARQGADTQLEVVKQAYPAAFVVDFKKL